MTTLEKILLALFLIITGILLVTNIRFTWQEPIQGFAALLAGGVIVWNLLGPNRSA
jgi:preprotein translocase subunit SecF